MGKLRARLATLLLAILLSALGAAAQGTYYRMETPAPYDYARVCNPPATEVPCSSQATIYSDSGLSTTVSQPVYLGTSGHLSFYAPAGQYVIQLTGKTARSFTIALSGGSGASTFDQVGAGTNTHALVIGSGGSLNATGTGVINATECNGSACSGSAPPNAVLYAFNYSGADASVKINACLAALPSTGGVCDARGLTGAQTIGTLIDIPANESLLLGDATFTTSLQPAIEWNNSVSILGTSPNNSGTSQGTQIYYTGSGTAGAELQAAAFSSYVTVKNIQVRRTGTRGQDGAIGINLDNTDDSTFTHVQVLLFDTDWKFGGSGTYYDSFYDDLGQAASTYDFDLEPNANNNTFVHPTCNDSGNTAETCYYINAVNDAFFNPDAESSGVGLKWAFDIQGRSNSIYDAYIEGTGTTGIDLEADAYFCNIIGGIGTSVQDNSPYWANNVVISPGAQTTASATSSLSGYPDYFKAKILALPNGDAEHVLAQVFGAAFAQIEPITSVSRTSNTVTVTMARAFSPAETANSYVMIAGVTSAGATDFNGRQIVVAATSGSSFTYSQTAADDTGTGGWAIIESASPAASALTLEGNGSHSSASIENQAYSSGVFLLPSIAGGDLYASQSPVTLTDAASLSFDFSTSRINEVTMTQNTTYFALNHATLYQKGMMAVFDVCEDSTGGWTMTGDYGTIKNWLPINTAANTCNYELGWWDGTNINILSGWDSTGHTLSPPPVANEILSGQLTTTAATSDALTITGINSSSICTFSPTDSSAASDIANDYISAVAANSVTLTHRATAGMTYNFTCTVN